MKFVIHKSNKTSLSRHINRKGFDQGDDNMEKAKGKEIVTVNEKGEKTIYIEGIGTVREQGKLNMEGLVKRLLQSKYITG